MNDLTKIRQTLYKAIEHTSILETNRVFLFSTDSEVYGFRCHVSYPEHSFSFEVTSNGAFNVLNASNSGSTNVLDTIKTKVENGVTSFYLVGISNFGELTTRKEIYYGNFDNKMTLGLFDDVQNANVIGVIDYNYSERFTNLGTDNVDASTVKTESLTVNKQLVADNIVTDIVATDSLDVKDLNANNVNVSDVATTKDLIVENKTTTATLNVTEDTITKSLQVNGTSTLEGNVTVKGATTTDSLEANDVFAQNVTVNEDVNTGSLEVRQNATVKGNLDVTTNVTSNSVVVETTTTTNTLAADDITGKTVTVAETTTTNNLNVTNNANTNALNVTETTTAKNVNVTETIDTTNLTASGIISADTVTVTDLIDTNDLNAESITATAVDVTGNATIANATITNGLTSDVAEINVAIIESATVNNHANVNNLNVNDLNLEGNLDVNGSSEINGDLNVKAGSTVTVAENSEININANVTFDTDSNFVVNGSVEANYVTITNGATFNGTSTLKGKTTITDATFTNITAPEADIATLESTNATITNVNSNDATIGTLNVDNLEVSQDVNATNVTADNLTIENNIIADSLNAEDIVLKAGGIVTVNDFGINNSIDLTDIGSKLKFIAKGGKETVEVSAITTALSYKLKADTDYSDAVLIIKGVLDGNAQGTLIKFFPEASAATGETAWIRIDNENGMLVFEDIDGEHIKIGKVEGTTVNWFTRKVKLPTKPCYINTNSIYVETAEGSNCGIEIEQASLSLSGDTNSLLTENVLFELLTGSAKVTADFATFATHLNISAAGIVEQYFDVANDRYQTRLVINPSEGNHVLINNNGTTSYKKEIELDVKSAKDYATTGTIANKFTEVDSANDTTNTKITTEISRVETKVNKNTSDLDIVESYVATQIDVTGSLKTDLVNATNNAVEAVKTQIFANESGDKDLSRVVILDEEGLVPASQLPGFVDDIINVESYMLLSTEAKYREIGKLYFVTGLDAAGNVVDAGTFVSPNGETLSAKNRTFRWTGIAHVEIANSYTVSKDANGVYRGDWGKANEDNIASNLVKINQNAADIETNAGVIANNKSNIASNRDDIDSNAKKIVANASRLDNMFTQAEINAKINIINTSIEGLENNKANKNDVYSKTYIDDEIAKVEIKADTAVSGLAELRNTVNSLNILDEDDVNDIIDENKTVIDKVGSVEFTVYKDKVTNDIAAAKSELETTIGGYQLKNTTFTMEQRDTDLTALLFRNDIGKDYNRFDLTYYPNISNKEYLRFNRYSGTDINAVFEIGDNVKSYVDLHVKNTSDDEYGKVINEHDTDVKITTASDKLSNDYTLQTLKERSDALYNNDKTKDISSNSYSGNNINVTDVNSSNITTENITVGNTTIDSKKIETVGIITTTLGADAITTNKIDVTNDVIVGNNHINKDNGATLESINVPGQTNHTIINNDGIKVGNTSITESGMSTASLTTDGIDISGTISASDGIVELNVVDVNERIWTKKPQYINEIYVGSPSATNFKIISGDIGTPDSPTAGVGCNFNSGWFANVYSNAYKNREGRHILYSAYYDDELNDYLHVTEGRMRDNYSDMAYITNAQIGSTSSTSSQCLIIHGTVAGFKMTTGQYISNYSDIRLKKDIELVEIPMLERLAKTNVYNYRYKDNDEKQQIGIIAQELQEIYPEIETLVNVGEDEDKTLTVNESALHYITIKSVQELNKEVQDLKDVVAEQQKQINMLLEMLKK